MLSSTLKYLSCNWCNSKAKNTIQMKNLEIGKLPTQSLFWCQTDARGGFVSSRKQSVCGRRAGGTWSPYNLFIAGSGSRRECRVVANGDVDRIHIIHDPEAICEAQHPVRRPIVYLHTLLTFFYRFCSSDTHKFPDTLLAAPDRIVGAGTKRSVAVEVAVQSRIAGLRGIKPQPVRSASWFQSDLPSASTNFP